MTAQPSTPAGALSRFELVDVRTGVVFVISAAVAWSTAGLFVRAVALDPWTILFWRSAFATGWILCWAAILQRPLDLGDNSPRLAMVVTIFLSAAGMIFFIPALTLTSVASVATIYATLPIVVAVVARMIFGIAMGRIGAIAIAGVAIGSILIVHGDAVDHNSLLGDALALLMMFCMAAMTLTLHRHAMPILPIVLWSNLLGAIVSLPFAWPAAISAKDCGLLATFGLVQMAIGLALFAAGARRLRPAETALLGTVELPLSPLWVWLAFGERPAMSIVFGAVVIFGSVSAYLMTMMIDGMRSPPLTMP